MKPNTTVPITSVCTYILHFLYETLSTDIILLFLHHLKATLSSWQSFEAERETVWRFISNTSKELHKELIFNTLDSLKSELEQNKVCIYNKCVSTCM